jgi:nucleoporin NUP159
VLGFSSLGKARGIDKKLRLLPNPWSDDNLPPSSASLLSIASKRGLLAAAGPDALVLTTTQSIRDAFKEEPEKDDKGNYVNELLKPFSPEVILPIPQLRHVAFSSDEDFLVATAESGGGLAVYAVDDALQKKKPTLQIPTDGIAVRALVPNPNPEVGQYYAAVLESGRLAIINVADNQTVTPQEENVTCMAWSNKGKAFVAGFKDGSAVQYKLGGGIMAKIPRPPNVEEGYSGKYSATSPNLTLLLADYV